MLTCFYRDVNKAAGDLLTQGYVGNSSLKFSTETKAGDFVLKSTASRSFVKNPHNKNELEETVVASVDPTLECKEHNLKFEGKLSTAADFTGTVSWKPSFLKDSRLSLAGASKEARWTKPVSIRTTVIPALEWQHEKFSTQASATLSLDGRPHIANVNLNVQPVDRLFVGGAGQFKFYDSKPVKASGEGKIAYVASDFSGHISVNWDKNRVADPANTPADKKLFGTNTIKLGYGFWRRFNSQLIVASTGTYDLSAPAGTGPKLLFGAQYKVDPNLTLNAKTEIGIKFPETEGKPAKETAVRFTIGETTNLSSNLSATVGVDFNVRKLLGSKEAKDDHSCGVEFKFKQ